ncbi:hypothetical protein WALSEDRAFT_56271 [Wallemia mellicola CBS 633.66]|uniref:Uncharacterized protein n=1 Tax=Wallemia mellicola (strain ATCC MYA-4683 / CBS 633.66) TaxID=671144 RepID=I4YIH1_WALMC|nr:hypothetical protein WALSEDRAFT_56271 [Wallemia mellicola CBS 633.66]EIM23763.1 hypothetical protein WALSEDRAFT_56271 [Wallemia mellicola CBS 633.66]|eukprot:XP_006956426.1 hypothetical protein WALSEDRAFT_56271 [Wallemia mellicola CBS 633.66]
MFGNNRFPLYLPITILLCSCINMVVAEHISESKNKEYFDDNRLLTSGYEDMGIQARNMLHSGDTSAYFKLLNYSFGASLVSCAAVQFGSYCYGANHADQVNDLAYKAVYDVDASKEGYYQFQLYNGEATDDCGLLTMQPTGYLDNSVDRELSNLCGPVA